MEVRSRSASTLKESMEVEVECLQLCRSPERISEKFRDPPLRVYPEWRRFMINSLHGFRDDSSRSSKRGYDRLKASKSDTNVNNSPDLQRNTYKGSLTPEAESAATTTLTIPTATTTLTIPTANTTLTIPTATTNLTMPTGTVPTAMGKGTTPTTDFLVDVTPVTSPSVSDASDYDDDDDDDDEDNEALTCNVCDRVFPTPTLLASHQTRKRHYGQRRDIMDKLEKKQEDLGFSPDKEETLWVKLEKKQED
nr:uncharacterized protein LOC128706629 [Cherax quadricarinatus]